MNKRKGVFTPKQEKLLDKLYKGKGVLELLDGVAIRKIDNIVIEKIKKKIPPATMEHVYEIVDEIMGALEALAGD